MQSFRNWLDICQLSVSTNQIFFCYKVAMLEEGMTLVFRMLFVGTIALGIAGKVAGQAVETPISAGNPVTAPFKWAGLWRWEPAPGLISTCTAQFIAPRVLLTAAHCVRDRETGEYYDRQNKKSVFLLQYQNENWSQVYHPICKVTWDDWALHLKPGEDPKKPETWGDKTRAKWIQSWQWDYAFIYVDRESTTKHANFDTKYSWPHAMSTGYPGDIMGGVVIQEAIGDVFSASVVESKAYPNVQVNWNGNLNLTQGSSGGAWFVYYKNKFLAVGLNSFGNRDRPGANFGPVFTADFATLLGFASRGCKPQ